MAEERLIELGILSASNLKDVNYISKMETYAVLTFPPYVEYTTQVDSKGGLNPSWNEKLGFLVPESVIRRGDNHLKVEIYTLSTLGPKFVSEASIPLSDLSSLLESNETIYKRYPLKTNSGDYHGDLHVSFAVGEKVILQQKGGPPSYPIVTKFGPPSYDSQQSSYPTPTSKPSHLGPSPTPTKPPKFTKPPQYGSDDTTQFQPSQFQPTTYFTDYPASRTTPPSPPSGFDTPPPSTYSPFPSRPAKPTTPSTYVEPSFPSKPHTLPETYETFPPSYGSPLPSKPQKPLPQPTPPSAFTQPPPYGPYEGGDSISYSPVKPPRAPPKFGTHGVNVPISRISDPTSFDQSGYGQGEDYPIKPSHTPPRFGTPRPTEPMGFEEGGYGHGVDYPIKTPKFGTSSINVPISKGDEDSTKFPSFEQSDYGQATRYGYQQVPTTSLNVLFGSPLGKILLTELSKSTVYDRRY